MIIKLTFAYTGALGAATIAWTKDGVTVTDGTFGGVTITGATTTTLTITSATSAWYGDYVATVTDEFACVAATESFHVGCALAILTQPEAQTVDVDGTASLTFTHSGTGPFTYQWKLNGTPLSDGTTGDGAVISGATTRTLTVEHFACLEVGDYTCVVTDLSFPQCTATTDPATVRMPCPTTFYYDFEAIVANAYDNATNDCEPFNFGLITQSGSTVQPGLIGNCVRYGDPVTVANPTNTLSGSYASCLELTGRSWTLRFWRKADDLAPEASGSSIAIWNGSGLQGVRVFWGKGPLPGDPFRYLFQVRPNDGGPFVLGVLGSYTAPEITVWHRIILAYDAPTRTFRFKFNNDAYVDFVQAAGFEVSSGANGIYLNGQFELFDLDELCVVLDKAWTEAEATYDWNSGAGRTYPDLPP